MPNLIASLFAQLAPMAHQQHKARDELDEIIDRLRQQQIELEERLSAMSDGVQKRRVKIALEVAQLQHRKAVALRTDSLRP